MTIWGGRCPHLGVIVKVMLSNYAHNALAAAASISSRQHVDAVELLDSQLVASNGLGCRLVSRQDGVGVVVYPPANPNLLCPR